MNGFCLAWFFPISTFVTFVLDAVVSSFMSFLQARKISSLYVTMINSVFTIQHSLWQFAERGFKKKRQHRETLYFVEQTCSNLVSLFRITWWLNFRVFLVPNHPSPLTGQWLLKQKVSHWRTAHRDTLWQHKYIHCSSQDAERLSFRATSLACRIKTQSSSYNTQF